LNHRSLPPEFKSRHRHIWRVFHLWLRFITFGDCSAHLAYHVPKSGRKPSINLYDCMIVLVMYMIVLVIYVIVLVIYVVNWCQDWSPHCVKSLKTPALQMSASSITPNWSVKTLGVIFDQCINMYENVTSVCRAPYYYLKNIHCLKAFLTQEALM